jgi:heat-inducible transcriptional repressor
MVLRAVVAAYVAEAAPASSATISHLLAVPLSSASIRNTFAELSRYGLIEKPHSSAGRVPTAVGLREFLDHLLEAPELAEYERRALQTSFDQFDAGAVIEATSQLLCERTRLLGFALAPRIERMVLRHVSLVRMARDKLLVVLVPQTGPVQQQLIDEVEVTDQAELDRMAASLNERVAGRTLPVVRALLTRELLALRSEARSLLARSLALGLRVFGRTHPVDSSLVLSSWTELLRQPEFDDPDRVRGLLAALETSERLLEVVGRMLDGETDALSISLGEELDEPALRQCAIVAIPYGGSGHPYAGAKESLNRSSEATDGPMGVWGVIGPSRMDYARIIPLVSYCSQLVTEKLSA